VIVFSATNEVTGDVFVGSTRESLEVEWVQLISQADEGASGGFFNQLRNHGAEKFEVEAYAYADSGSELRELTREAREELSAEAIKSSRRTRSSSVVGNSSMSMEAIMASIEEAAKDAEAGTLSAAEPAARLASSKTSTSGLSLTPSAPKPEPKIATGRSGSASKEKRIREAIATEREARDQLRHTDSRESQAEMNSVIARIEQRRQENKVSPKKPAAKKASAKKGASANATGSNGATASKSAAKSARLATGRTGSSAKEKRIKEAIAQEKAEREAQHQANASAEADEMAAILARLDSRGKDADKLKRRR
jgi:hypothetical protein